MDYQPENPEHLLVTLHDQIKTITFNQPKKKNAISADMSYHLRDVIEQTREDDSRVIILTGAEGNFCSGADLDASLMNGKPFDVTTFLRRTYNPIVSAMREINKPFIAKVSGACVGVGFNFALACDLIYTSDDAKFSQIFSRIGLSSDGGGAFFLPEKVGYHKAYEMMVTNAIIDAAEAKQLGIVNQVYSADMLDSAVSDIANRLATGPYIAIKNIKANLRSGVSKGLAETLEQEAISQGENFRTSDFFEGIFAFLQKRSPNFKGK
ncbi:MAG: enoyl-CoA hydratase-related protein [Bacteroidia bacterium]|nr:enoyl-CoA hydratase-related protein [Bacteroidia bacterium]